MKLEPEILIAARAALDKKAEGLSLLDLRGLSDVTDYFLICHGRSGRQVQTISDTIEQALRLERRRPGHVEGYARGEWILMDYFDFVVHIFTLERRSFYALERLWADAPRLKVPGADRAGARRAAPRRHKETGEEE
jgi:ribosome-associated protein